MPASCLFIRSKLFVLPVMAMFAVFFSEAQTKNPLTIKMKPLQKDGIFHSSDKVINYNIKFKNEVKDIQRGNYLFDVRNDSGRSIFHDAGGFAINQGGSFEREITIEKYKLQPGCYEISLATQTFYYKDTLSNFFCYDPEIIAFTDNARPDDFSAYWEDAKRSLYNTYPSFTVNRRNDLADNYTEVYSVEYLSVDNITIRGWLTVPKGRGKYPVLYKLGDLNEPTYPEKFKDKAIFSIDVRGFGNSAEDNLRLKKDDYITKNANNKNKFIGKGVYLDCLRGIDFLYKSSDLRIDTSKIVVVGIGQGAPMAVAAVALSGKVKGLELIAPQNFDLFNLLMAADEKNNFTDWPVNVIRDFIINPANKTTRDDFERTWSYFDPVNFASQIKCNFLMGANLRNPASPAKCIYHFLNKLAVGRRDIYVCPECNNNEMDYSFKVMEQVWFRGVF